MAGNNDRKDKESRWVWVKDREGNRFMCPISALMDPKKLSREELEKCMSVGKATPELKD